MSIKRGGFMPSIDDFQRIFQQVSSQMEAASSMTDRLQLAIRQNHDFITKAFYPYDRISQQIEAFAKVIAPQNSIFTQMQSAFARYENMIPRMMKDFEIASAVFEIGRAHV
jgi:hypothetical protein